MDSKVFGLDSGKQTVAGDVGYREALQLCVEVNEVNNDTTTDGVRKEVDKEKSSVENAFFCSTEYFLSILSCIPENDKMSGETNFPGSTEVVGGAEDLTTESVSSNDTGVGDVLDEVTGPAPGARRILGGGEQESLRGIPGGDQRGSAGDVPEGVTGEGEAGPSEAGPSFRRRFVNTNNVCGENPSSEDVLNLFTQNPAFCIAALKQLGYKVESPEQEGRSEVPGDRRTGFCELPLGDIRSNQLKALKVPSVFLAWLELQRRYMRCSTVRGTLYALMHLLDRFLRTHVEGRQEGTESPVEKPWSRTAELLTRPGGGIGWALTYCDRLVSPNETFEEVEPEELQGRRNNYMLSQALAISLGLPCRVRVM